MADRRDLVGRGAITAAAPFVPLLVLAGALGLTAALTPWGAPPPLPSHPTTTVQPAPEEARRRFVTPTTLATAVAWDRRALELTTASMKRGATWYVVSNTGGAGVYLRARPSLAERRQVLPEGALLVEISVSIDPTWKHVWVAPDGPGGWVPSEYVAEMP
ncbi:MAG TPA: hypothetical protein VG370_10040 [Chloroflexota bacterium]|nr:hypothetical protein [Chloroflexota bacterium]